MHEREAFARFEQLTSAQCAHYEDGAHNLPSDYTIRTTNVVKLRICFRCSRTTLNMYFQDIDLNGYETYKLGLACCLGRPSFFCTW
jgi:hypothetical protein